MVKGSKSRQKLKVGYHRKGVSIFFQEFKVGDKVTIDILPSSHEGMPHHRFQGRIGEVIGKRGDCYLVKINDKFKEKILTVAPQHLRKI